MICYFWHLFFFTLLTFNFSYRLLQISSFNGKMNALNEVNKVISSVSYYTHRHGNPEEEEWLTAERMAVSSPLHRNSLNRFSSSLLLHLQKQLCIMDPAYTADFHIQCNEQQVSRHGNKSFYQQSVQNCCICFKAAVENYFSVLLKHAFKRDP